MNIEILIYGRTFLKIKRMSELDRCKDIYEGVLIFVFIIYFCHLFNDLESFERRCWKSMEKISWTERVRNEEVSHNVREERTSLHTTKRRKADWICHILCRNCLLKHVIEGKIEGRI
jgi:hypothetical protein